MASSGPELGNVEVGLVKNAESALSTRRYFLLNSGRRFANPVHIKRRAHSLVPPNRLRPHKILRPTTYKSSAPP